MARPGTELRPEARSRLLAFSTLVCVTVLAPDAWRNSISWYGFGVVVLVVFAGSVVVLVRERHAISWSSVPRSLLVFLLLAGASIVWSAYRPETAVAALLQFITTAVALALVLVLESRELVVVLGRALRIILALSVAFELVVALVVRAPVLPVWVSAEDRIDPNPLLYWSRNVLFDDGKIQGIVGSSTLLAMLALVALIVFGVQVATRTVRPLPGLLWALLALVVIALTRSATVLVALAAVVVVLAVVLVLRRARDRRQRILALLAATATVVLLLAVAVALRGELLELLGKNSTFTGRAGIWEAVIGIARERPVLGWGWISFWAPWVEPYRGLAYAAGMMQLHAHNAWLDVWVQLGVVGLVVFGALVVTAGARAIRLAASRDAWEHPGRRIVLLPPLLLTALVVQSLAESRLLTEGGWVLLVVVAAMVKRESALSSLAARAPLSVARAR